MAEEILYIKANIDDINAKLDQLDKKINKVKGDASGAGDNLASGMNKGAAATQNATTELKKQEQEVSGLGTKFKAIGAAIGVAFATRQIIDFTKKAIILAQEVRGVEKAFNKIDDPGLLNNLRNATQGAVSDLELMKSAVNAKNLGVPIEKLGTLFQFASQRAAETGQNVQQLVTDIVGGLGRKSTLVLDNLGISAIDLKKGLNGVSLEAASVAELTDSLAGIIEGQLDPAFLGATSSTDKFSAMMTNLTASVGKNLLPAFDETVDILTEIGNALLGIDFSDTFDGSEIEGFNTELERVQANVIGISLATIGGAKNFKDFQEEQAALQSVLAQSNILLSEDVNELNKFLEDQANAYIVAGRETETYKAFIEQVQSRIKQLTETQEETIETTKGILEALREQLKLTDELINKALSQKEINRLLTQREEIEARINAILNDRNKLQTDDLDAFISFTEKILEEETKIADARIAANAKRKELEDSATKAYEEALDAKIAADQAEIQSAKDRRDYLVKMRKEEADATVSAASFAFGQLKTLYAEDAEAQKVFAIFDAIISAYQAINTTMASVPYPANIPLSVAIGALAFANVAKIASEPVPSYFEGTDSLKRGNNPRGRDTIPVMAHEGEAIIPTALNKKYPGLSSAWIKGDLDRYINVNHVLPAIAKIKQDKRIQELKLTGVGSSGFNDERLLRQLKKNNKSTDAMIEFLATRRANYNPYRL